MAIDANVGFVNTNGLAFPDTEGVNASGPTETDGTEFVKLMIDNYMFGPQQALLNYAGLTPNGIAEANGASQELEALQKSFGYPGEAVNWYGQQDPAIEGARILLLEGQGVLVANFQALTNVVYVGDGNNATAPAFYRADDPSGAVRNIAGDYLILPDMRDVFPRANKLPVFSAVIPSSGVAATDQVKPGWIDSISWSGNQVTVNFNTSLITEAPNIAGMTILNDTLVYTVKLLTLTATQAVFRTQENTDSTSDIAVPFHLVIQRKEADFNPFGDNYVKPGIRY